LQSILPAIIADRKIPRPKGADVGTPDPATINRMIGTYLLDDGGALVVSEHDGVVTASASGSDAVNALFSQPRGFAADDVESHEMQVLELLNGDDAIGKAERQLLDKALGSIKEVQLRGTIAEDGELRTYVTIVGREDTLEGWYALDSQGGVAGAQVPADLPSLTFENQRGDTLISTDPTGQRPDNRISVVDGQLTIDNGTGLVTARRTD
jgi:hypothetical protein